MPSNDARMHKGELEGGSIEADACLPDRRRSMEANTRNDQPLSLALSYQMGRASVEGGWDGGVELLAEETVEPQGRQHARQLVQNARQLVHAIHSEGPN
jgi:hypothetical protein